MRMGSIDSSGGLLRYSCDVLRHDTVLSSIEASAKPHTERHFYTPDLALPLGRLRDASQERFVQKRTTSE
jgi:hypothetical protein